MRRKRKNRKRQRRTKKEEDTPTEVLSQEEIDQLLAAINAGNTETEGCHPVCDSRKIKIYDFKRPDKFSKDQIRTMSILHETAARNATSILTSKFKMPCYVRVASVDQLTYEEFARSIPIPATIAVVSVEQPLSRQVILEIDPVISFAFINRAFGGDASDTNTHRELTRLEWVVMKDVIGGLIDCMKQGWKTIIPELKADIHSVDTTPQFINVVHPSDMTVLVNLEVKIGDVEGMINIDYPYDCLSGVMERLSSQFWYGGDKSLMYSKKYKLIDPMNVPVEIVAEIFRRDYPLQVILGWEEESLLLPLAPRVPNTCFLRFGNRRVFECLMVEDEKWFPKKVLIENVTENPYRMEGKMEISAVNPLVADALAEAGITISVELGRTVKTVNEILKMCEGTIVELDKLAGELVDIKANGVLIAKGEVVVIDENFGVRVVEIVKSFGSLNSRLNENEDANE
jgi:flagellar motor switch protein FliM